MLKRLLVALGLIILLTSAESSPPLRCMTEAAPIILRVKIDTITWPSPVPVVFNFGRDVHAKLTVQKVLKGNAPDSTEVLLYLHNKMNPDSKTPDDRYEDLPFTIGKEYIVFLKKYDIESFGGKKVSVGYLIDEHMGCLRYSPYLEGMILGAIDGNDF